MPFPVIRKSILALGGILFILPSFMLRFTMWGIPTTVLELIILVFVAVVFITNIKKLKNLKNLGTINYAIALFVLAAVISTIISPEKIKALGQLKAFFIEPVLFFYACVLILPKTEDLKLPLTMLLSSSLVISIFGILQYWTLFNLPLRFWGVGEGLRRITSLFEYPNALALFLAPIACFALALLYKNSYLVNRKLLIWSSMLGLLALFLTFSRGAWLAVLVVILFLTAKKYTWKVAVGFVAIIIAVLIFIQPSRASLNDASVFSRIELYKYSVNALLQNPLLGNGLTGFRNTLQQSSFPAEILNYPHNIILNFWLEIGILGMLSFFFIILLCLKQYKLKPTPLKLAGSMFLLAVFAHGLVDAPYFKNDLSILFWFMSSIFFIED